MSEAAHVNSEISSQPRCWQLADELVRAGGAQIAALPQSGERVAVAGCGTSWFIAQAYAALREGSGHGHSDAFAASEFPRGRTYDRLVVITRSGTTTEVLDLVADARTRLPTVAITADATAGVAGIADSCVVLDFADERSVVQTRFATTALVLLRSHLGESLAPVIAAGAEAVAWSVPEELIAVDRYAFLGRGWSIGLTSEAALKMREASLSWADAYPAMEYRHGPISLADARTLVWLVGSQPADSLANDVAHTGARVVAAQHEPLADLVRIQRLAVATGLAKGLDPDQPRHLTRSVILDHPGQP